MEFYIVAGIEIGLAKRPRPVSSPAESDKAIAIEDARERMRLGVQTVRIIRVLGTEAEVVWLNGSDCFPGAPKPAVSESPPHQLCGKRVRINGNPPVVGTVARVVDSEFGKMAILDEPNARSFAVVVCDVVESTPELVRLGQWAARCECYNGHNSSSGRCNARDVTDPTAKPGQAVYCKSCRTECCKRP